MDDFDGELWIDQNRVAVKKKLAEMRSSLEKGDEK